MAYDDSPMLWQLFSVRVRGELFHCPALNPHAQTYGVLKMLDERNFLYWAAVEIGADKTGALSADLEIITIPQGLYVKCSILNLARLGDAFDYMHRKWPQTQDKYDLNTRRDQF